MYNLLSLILRLPIILKVNYNYDLSYKSFKAINIFGIQEKEYYFNLDRDLSKYLFRLAPKRKNFELIVATNKLLINWYSYNYITCIATRTSYNHEYNRFQNYRINKKHTYSLCEEELIKIFGYIPKTLYFII